LSMKVQNLLFFQTPLVSYFETKKIIWTEKMNEIDSVSNYFTILSKGTGTEKGCYVYILNPRSKN